MLKKCVLAVALVGAMMLTAAADRPVKKANQSVVVLDSTEAQWGRRSINDSVYRGYTVNAVYLERGRQRLPDSFKMYRPTPVTTEESASSDSIPVTITVNGQRQTLPPR